MNHENISLSVVIPLYCEEDNVKALVDRVHVGLKDCDYPWELICVDDGSHDQTVSRMQTVIEQTGQHVRLIELSRNFGQTAAMQAGIDAARGSLIATLDGDLQNDPADIPAMVKELLERDLDLLTGWRKNRKDALVLRKIPSRIANRLIGKVTGVRIHDYGCSLKIYRTEVIRKVRLYGEMHRFIPVWVASVTDPKRIGETVVSHAPRLYGESKYGISRTFRVILDLLAVFFFLRYRARPGHFFGSIGLSFGALGTVLMTYLTFIKFALGDDIGGRPLLMIAILSLLASLIFLTTGILAELLARIYFEANPTAAYTQKNAPEQNLDWHSGSGQKDADPTDS